MESKTADISVKLAFVKNQYIGQVRGDFLSCGNEPIQVARDFKLRPDDADMVHDTWIATEISGFLGQETVKTGGMPACFGAIRRSRQTGVTVERVTT